MSTLSRRGPHLETRNRCLHPDEGTGVSVRRKAPAAVSQPCIMDFETAF
ncbi:MAG: hypothetical protein OYM47_16190 [Gemmatimonadota bacterium]|nr:hypothetical protein [Gemmatimonadota bacterium]